MRILLTSLNSKYVHSNLAIRYLFASFIEHFGVEKTAIERLSDGGFRGRTRTRCRDKIQADCGDEILIEMREFTINNSLDYIYSEILRANYDMVCFSCYIWNVEKIKELGETIKKASPKMVIALGGPEVSFNAMKFMNEEPWTDFIMVGEGEDSFPRLCEALISPDLDFKAIGGLTYRKGQKVGRNQHFPAVDFAKVPFPYDYISPDSQKVAYYESTRGCPYGCSYCMSSIEKGVRKKDIETVKRELSYFIDREAMQVKFVDRTFNYDAKRAYELFDFLIEKDNGKTNFHFEICGELLDEDTFTLLEKARPGLFQMEIGIQSTNENTLKAINRVADLKRLRGNIERLVGMKNIHTHVDLIAGLPFEDYKTFANSFDDVYSLGCQMIQLGFLKVLKGTPMYEQVQSHEIIYRSRPPYEVISTKYISPEELVKLKMIENMVDVYYNRGGFSKAVDYLIKALKFKPFMFYENLAMFYYKKGYHHRERKKEDQYNILLRYVEDLLKSGALKADECEIAKQTILTDAKEYMNPEIFERFQKKGIQI